MPVFMYVRVYCTYCMYVYSMYYHNVRTHLAVPTPTVSITAPSTPSVYQSLTLECSVAAVRGITSKVDIIWRYYGVVVRRVNDTLQTIMDSLPIYTDSYTIPRLCPCSADQNEVYQCEVVINTSPPAMVTSSVTLEVIGKIYTV